MGRKTKASKVEQALPPTLSDLVRQHMFRRFGLPGIAVFAFIAFLIPFFYSNTDLGTWPGISHMLSYIKERSLPKPDAERFSVLIARLERDSDNDYQRLIIETLRDFQGMQIVAVDEIIPVEGAVPEQMVQSGHKIAQGILRQKGGSILIWGNVVKIGKECAPSLYWTAADGAARHTRPFQELCFEQPLRLPRLIWSELAEVLKLLLTSWHDDLLDQRRYMVDKLSPFIAKVQKLIERSPATDLQIDSSTEASIRMILGDSLMIKGEQVDDRKVLSQAVAQYREVLKLYSRDKEPNKWAMAKSNLGLALHYMAHLDPCEGNVLPAIEEYNEALSVWKREDSPLEWAMTKNNLGAAMKELGQQKQDVSVLRAEVAPIFWTVG